MGSATPLTLWRQDHFGTTANTGPAADPDGDGKTNRDEYAAGTGPNNAADFFRILTTAKTATGYTVTAAGKAGRRYVLERSTAPGAAAWTSVGTVGSLGADGPIMLTDPAPPLEAGCYRLRVTVP